MDERKIWTFPRETAVDIGKRGYDMCAGHGRVDALRAVRNNRIDVYVRIPLFPEYQG